MNMNLVEGRWFIEEDYNAVIRPMIVNQNFMNAYYPNKSMIDSIILFHGERRLVGVVDEYRYGGEFEEAINIRFDPEPYTELMANAVIKLKPGTTLAYAEKLSNLVNTTTKTTGSSFQTLDKRKKESSRESWVLLYALMTVCIFLCLNVALGLFGVLWYNINKRKAEIGLRQAMGASGFDITKQFIIEMLILSGFALVVGIFFVIQIPILDVTEYDDSLFYRAITYASLIMLALVTLCALFPAIQAARITPANSLHED
jgi:putative ABC transport system permease protein